MSQTFDDHESVIQPSTILKQPSIARPWRNREQPATLRQQLPKPIRYRPPQEITNSSNGMQSTMYRHLGARPATHDGVNGVRFAVWAPNARDVSVICDTNGWKHGQFPLKSSDSGVWSGFMPQLKHGDTYKYSLRTAEGYTIQKSDPYAFFCEHPPKTASIVYDLEGYPWRDETWMTRRAETNWHDRPISVFEIHLGSWKRPRDGRRYFNYRELAHMLVEYCQTMGYTHIQLMPINEHPFDGSWGYQATGYFAPTSRFGTPHDFMYFVDFCHQAHLGVLVDWVPGHFPTDAHSLGKFDGTSLYEHADPRKGFHPDWGTLIFNYGRNEVRDFLLSSARFWLDKYHVDGLRVDAVASMLYLDYSRRDGEWIPNQYGGRENLEAIQFLKDTNTIVHRDFQGVLTIAEESTAWGGVSHPVHFGGLGFNMKWDMGWMNDTLRYLRRDPMYRSFHQHELSFRMIYAFTENFVLPLSHDEVVHGKKSLLSQMPGDYWQQFGNLRCLYGYQYTTPGKKLLFMGGEFGQWTEWNHDGELDWALLKERYHDGIRRLIGDLNALYRSQPALHETDFDQAGFKWIQCDDWQNSVYAFERRAKNSDDQLVVLLNFTPVVRNKYRVGVPRPGYYRELLNSDAGIYGGGNLGNAGGLYSEPVKAHGYPQSLELMLPPLSVLVLKAV
ncbi:MAG: 1,4-alpha-glucan branching protein GlgB [Planctomycetaceae bacterium]